MKSEFQRLNDRTAVTTASYKFVVQVAELAELGWAGYRLLNLHREVEYQAANAKVTDRAFVEMLQAKVEAYTELMLANAHRPAGYAVKLQYCETVLRAFTAMVGLAGGWAR